MYFRLLSLCLLTVQVISSYDKINNHSRQKRLLPNNQQCNPLSPGSCAKGDFVDPSIADCQYQRTPSHPVSCTAQGNTGKFISWVVAPDKNGLCRPKTSAGVKFPCGSEGTNTRCVCSDYKINWNRCRCQYWTRETPGESEPGFCTAHYLGGETGIHHYSCCNNCRDGGSPPTCDGITYEGGSTSSYCGECGKPTGGGLLKWYFNCVNCTIQSQCQSYCNKRVSTAPGFCWKWVNCFKGCCSSHSSSSSSSSSRLIPSSLVMAFKEEVGFCGDTVCQSYESPSTCPSDCCYKVNNGTCPAGGVICSPYCCEQENCCQ